MDNKDNRYPSFNTPSSSGGRKNTDSGQFKTSIDGKSSDIYSNSTTPQGQGSSARRNGGRTDFSVNIPKQQNLSSSGRNVVRSSNSSTAQRENSPTKISSPRSIPQSQNQSKRTASSPSGASRTAGSAKKAVAPSQRTASASKSSAGNAAGAAANAKKNNSAKTQPARSKAAKKSAPRGSRMMTAEEKQLMKEKKRRARLRSLLATIVCVVFISIITISLSVIAISTINDILCIGKESGVTISVVVEKGDDFEKVFNTLCDNGLVSQKQLSRLFCLYRKYDTVKYEPGVYYFDTADGVEAMLEEMMVSKNNLNSVVRLTFPEGWSTAKIFQKIEKYEVCSAEKLYANLDIVAEQYKFYQKITSKNGRYLMTEGYLFPDTYEFYKGESASSVLKKLFKNFKEHWTEEYTTRAKELGLSTDEVLTIASIIQREAGSVAQMKDISSVIHNRLRSIQYKKLQLDSTTDYIYSINSNFKLFSDYDYSLYYEAYNTYSNEGLPPGPICNPGKSAIEAALYPNETSYYFFVHDSNGEMYLASTEYEHQQNVARVFSESN